MGCQGPHVHSRDDFALHRLSVALVDGDEIPYSDFWVGLFSYWQSRFAPIVSRRVLEHYGELCPWRLLLGGTFEIWGRDIDGVEGVRGLVEPDEAGSDWLRREVEEETGCFRGRRDRFRGSCDGFSGSCDGFMVVVTASVVVVTASVVVVTASLVVVAASPVVVTAAGGSCS